MKSQNGRRWAQSAGCCNAAFPQRTVMSRTNTRRASAQHRPAGPPRAPPDWTLCPTPKLFRLSLPLSLSNPAKCSESMLPISSMLGITYVKINNYTLRHPGHGSNANSSEFKWIFMKVTKRSSLIWLNGSFCPVPRIWNLVKVDSSCCINMAIYSATKGGERKIHLPTPSLIYGTNKWSP